MSDCGAREKYRDAFSCIALIWYRRDGPALRKKHAPRCPYCEGLSLASIQSEAGWPGLSGSLMRDEVAIAGARENVMIFSCIALV